MNQAKPGNKVLTNAEMLVLGLVAEMPRHGYQIEQEIDRRAMRQWTQIGFSSIYFVLGKLEREGLISAQKPVSAKARKTFTLTSMGRSILVEQTLAALGGYQPTYSSVLAGMIHWPVLGREDALGALEARLETVRAELERQRKIQVEQQPLPDYIEAIFDFSVGQLAAETEWIVRILNYMKTKPWLE